MDRLISPIRKKTNKSRVQQFYSDFNSDDSSDSDSKSDKDNEARVFTFRNAKAPVLRPEGPGYFEYEDSYLHPHYDIASFHSRPVTPRNVEISTEMPLSPGVTKNQELKDAAYEVIYGNKIKELRSIFVD